MAPKDVPQGKGGEKKNKIRNHTDAWYKVCFQYSPHSIVQGDRMHASLTVFA